MPKRPDILSNFRPYFKTNKQTNKPLTVKIFGCQTWRPTHSPRHPPPSCRFICKYPPHNPFIVRKYIPLTYLHFSHCAHFTLPPLSNKRAFALQHTFVSYNIYVRHKAGRLLEGYSQGPPNRHHSLSGTFLPHALTKGKGCLLCLFINVAGFDPPCPRFAS